MRTGLPRLRRGRRLVLLVAFMGALVLLWQSGSRTYLSGFGSVGSRDFVVYWSAGRLLLERSNPYDPSALLAVEQSVGWEQDHPWMSWNPPWMLLLALPFAALPFWLATVIWAILQLLLILGSSVLLWRDVAPGDTRYWIPLTLAAAFVPGLLSLRIGQVAVWLLLGVIGFLYGAARKRDGLAGASLALLMIKPHVTYLVWMAALWWVWRNRRWRLILGWLGALLVTSGVALLLTPGIFGNYFELTRGVLTNTVPGVTPPLYYATPTLGAELRHWFGVERFWLQFAPALLVGPIFLAWLLCRRRPWRWKAMIGWLLLASSFTAPYGGICDQLVLLPVVLIMVSRLRGSSPPRRALVLGGYALSQFALVILNLYLTHEFYLTWHVPVLAILYWLSTHHIPETQGHEALSVESDQPEGSRTERRHGMTTVLVENVTRGHTLVANGRVADSFLTRLRGLIGHGPLDDGEGLLIVPCNSIHTHFMGYPIDVLYVDRSQKVVAIDHDMKPWRFGRIRRGARLVIELPAGTVQAAGTEVGDQLRVEGYRV